MVLLASIIVIVLIVAGEFGRPAQDREKDATDGALGMSSPTRFD
jgi:hypothetical protein